MLTSHTESTPQLPLSENNGNGRKEIISLDAFRLLIKHFAKDCGSNAELGRRLGVTGQFIDQIIAGKKNPGPKLFKAVDARPVLMVEITINESD